MRFEVTRVPDLPRKSIARISLSDEMSPWRLGTTYDRPIPRRIVEEAGVEREAFGQHKKAILVHRTEPVHPDLREKYLEWVAHHFDRRPIAYRARVFADRAYYLSASALRKLSETLFNMEERNLELEPLWHDYSPRDMMFRWAANTVADRYRSITTSRSS